MMRVTCTPTQYVYREFVAATLEANGQLSQEKLAEAFDRLDSDNSGFITKANLKELLGEDYDEAEADEAARCRLCR